MNVWRVRAVNATADYLLPFGLFVFLAGCFLAADRSAYKTIVYIGTLAPSLALLALVPRRAIGTVSRRPGLMLALAFLVWMAASSLWASEPDGSNYIKYAFFIALMLFAIVLAGSSRRLVIAFDAACVVAAIAAVVYLVRFYVLAGHPMSARIIGYNGLSNPLYSGYLYGVFLVYVLVRLPTQRRWSRVLLTAALAPLAVFVWFTGSRTPLLALPIAVLVQLRYRGSRFKWLLAGVLAAYAGAFALGFHRLLARGTSHRLQLWGDSVRLWLDSPWIGHGVGNRIDIVTAAGLHFYDTHNIHLAVAYFGGAIGLALWAALLARCALVAWRRAAMEDGCLALSLLVYGMAAGSFDGGHLIARPIEMWFLLWLPIGLCLRLDGAQRPVR